jgi:hypothetical protein
MMKLYFILSMLAGALLGFIVEVVICYIILISIRKTIKNISLQEWYRFNNKELLK